MYQLIDSGEGRKLEQFGPYLLDRPAPQAIWAKRVPEKWPHAHFVLERVGEKAVWKKERGPLSWTLPFEGLEFLLKRTSFGHVGLFPEHAQLWPFLQEQKGSLLNLFAYSGGATLAAAKGGASVTHVDSSKQSVTWAKENAEQSGLADKPIRWIVDDAVQFVAREVRRGRTYDGILLDPPTFGRGPKGQVFKLEEECVPLVEMLVKLLAPTGFILWTSHTPGWTPCVLECLLKQGWPKFSFTSGELLLDGKLPSGAYTLGRGACYA